MRPSNRADHRGMEIVVPIDIVLVTVSITSHHSRKPLTAINQYICLLESALEKTNRASTLAFNFLACRCIWYLCSSTLPKK